MSAAIRLSNCSVHKTKERRRIKRNSCNIGGNPSVLEEATEGNAAAARIDTHQTQEDAGGKASPDVAPAAVATVTDLKEIDAMVPKTHAEMLAYLGAKRTSLEKLELSPKGANDKWIVPSSRRRLLEQLPAPSDDDADASHSGRSDRRGSKD